MAQQRRDPEQRPSPEALLEAARWEESQTGRFKIFVGAAKKQPDGTVQTPRITYGKDGLTPPM